MQLVSGKHRSTVRQIICYISGTKMWYIKKNGRINFILTLNLTHSLAAYTYSNAKGRLYGPLVQQSLSSHFRLCDPSIRTFQTLPRSNPSGIHAASQRECCSDFTHQPHIGNHACCHLATHEHTQLILEWLAANLTNFCTSSELLRHPVWPKIGSRYSIRDWGSDGSWQCDNGQKAVISHVSWSLLQTKKWCLNKHFLKWWIFFRQFGLRWMSTCTLLKGWTS